MEQYGRLIVISAAAIGMLAVEIGIAYAVVTGTLTIDLLGNVGGAGVAVGLLGLIYINGVIIKDAYGKENVLICIIVLFLAIRIASASRTDDFYEQKT